MRDHKRGVLTYLQTITCRMGCDDRLALQLLLLAEGAQTSAAIDVGQRQTDAARHAAAILIEQALPAIKRVRPQSRAADGQGH